jgi:uncharacterized metal-binding protein YceD (DUF177 family)
VGEGATVVVEANAAELAALALRLRVPEVISLMCRFNLQRAEGAAIPATGSLLARVVQACVVSLETFEADIAEDFTVRFVPAGTESDDLDLEAVDEIPYVGNVLDLGEAAAEQLALALDPFPRKPGAALPEDGQAAPKTAFAALGKLQQQG